MGNESPVGAKGYGAHKPFGVDTFGNYAEWFARFFGTPTFLLSQTVFVTIWIIYNAICGKPFDPYPFILLNLVFSTQAAYAAPLILLAQTRQAEIDKVWEYSDAAHREELHKMVVIQQQHVAETSRQILEIAKNLEAAVAEIHSHINKN